MPERALVPTDTSPLAGSAPVLVTFAFSSVAVFTPGAVTSTKDPAKTASVCTRAKERILVLVWRMAYWGRSVLVLG